jgi:drug/metabolite transporter (DMT)-like permease
MIGFLGTLIILRPGVNEFSLAAASVLAGCFCMAIALIIVKKLTDTETPFNMMFHMHLWMAVFSIPLAFTHWYPLSGNMLLWCYGLAVCSIIGQYSLARAYTLVDVTLTLPFDFTRLIIASIVAYFAFGEVPDIYAYIGAGIITASAVFIAHREARLRKLQRKPIIEKI